MNMQSTAACADYMHQQEQWLNGVISFLVRAIKRLRLVPAGVKDNMWWWIYCLCFYDEAVFLRLIQTDCEWGTGLTGRRVERLHRYTEQMMGRCTDCDNCPWQVNVPELLGGSAARCGTSPACLGFGPITGHIYHAKTQSSQTARHDNSFTSMWQIHVVCLCFLLQNSSRWHHWVYFYKFWWGHLDPPLQLSSSEMKHPPDDVMLRSSSTSQNFCWLLFQNKTKHLHFWKIPTCWA